MKIAFFKLMLLGLAIARKPCVKKAAWPSCKKFKWLHLPTLVNCYIWQGIDCNQSGINTPVRSTKPDEAST